MTAVAAASGRRYSMEQTAMKTVTPSRESGFSLIEALVAGVILSVGLLGLAYAYGQGTVMVVYSQQMAIARQKAREAIENVMAARNNQTLTWDQINNVSNGGVFIDGAELLLNPGLDGIVNTVDDGASAVSPCLTGTDCIVVPGTDGLLSDGTPEPLSNYTRKIAITSINSDLKQVVVTITYTTPRGLQRSYQMTCYVSPYV
ncbi:MAG TPA: prepilin-type N-terminal cleavage/methylation domain-containing protein [Terriglobia bacterium]|nr:prepilin-type N-terminal cleavage/methylation domain-containing protein [Terriglobia bacterium]